jgi:hypothetical protein
MSVLTLCILLDALFPCTDHVVRGETMNPVPVRLILNSPSGQLGKREKQSPASPTPTSHDPDPLLENLKS